MNKLITLLGIACIGIVACQNESCGPPDWSSVKVQYDTISGIGYEEECTRRDPSDIIEVNGIWYVYYTKVFGQSAGYWGTIWAAKSTDAGFSWTEIGEVLGIGTQGAFDSQATFTPNILKHKKKFYLYYTGVKPTHGRDDGVFENNSINDYTGIGVATSNSPEGPFERHSPDPIIAVNDDAGAFDSYRVDDAQMMYRDQKFWMYYKGRSSSHGATGPRHTQMGVAFADQPEGPFLKYKKNPILDKSHEVLAWPQGPGVACLASISSTFEFAPDGLDFMSDPVEIKIQNRPNAPGLFRPDLTKPVQCGILPEWGISMVHNGSECYLIRFNYICNSN